ncbi:interleukin-33 isoform X2 [Sorex fumeus]|uniref:interleukin-33 isoform X2 n=1 Tax=Sorex fumeus TaxID=62283 RepID=UPI0024AC8A50|nr:interleukin-33 isoform X2 [Sorex fumeus]
MLNNSIHEGHFCLVPDFREENFTSSWRMMLAAGLFYMAYTILRNLEIKTKLLKRSTKKTSPEKKNNFLETIKIQIPDKNSAVFCPHAGCSSPGPLGGEWVELSSPPRPGLRQPKTSRTSHHHAETTLRTHEDSKPITQEIIQRQLRFPTILKSRQCDQTPFQKKLKTCVARKSSTDVTVRSGRTVTSSPISKVTEAPAFLRTYDNQLVYFTYDNKDSEIYIQHTTTEQEKENVLFTFYRFQASSEPVQGDVVDGQRSIVSLSPEKNRRLLLHADANDEEQSVKLQEIEESLPGQEALFHLHMISSYQHVKFECTDNPGVYIGVKDNHLTLIKKEDETGERNTIFTISQIKLNTNGSL